MDHTAGPILEIGRRRGIPILEDACQAVGASWNGRTAGSMGRLAAFSFYPTKNLGAAGDAGAVTTDDDALAEIVRSLRIHGSPVTYHHQRVGGNFRQDALQAAVLLAKLPRLAAWNERRREIASGYAALLARAESEGKVRLPREASGRRHVYHQYVLRVAEQIGYRPDSRARLLAGRRSRLLGVTLTLNHPFHADLAEGIYSSAEQLGYEVVLSAITPQREPRRAIDTLLDYRCEAAILVGALVREPWLSALGERLPVVVVGQGTRSQAVDVVRTSDAAGIRLAVEHLVELGHRIIAHVDGGRGPGAAARRNAYRAGLRRHGLTPRVVPGGQSEEDGASAGRVLLACSASATSAVGRFTVGSTS